MCLSRQENSTATPTTRRGAARLLPVILLILGLAMFLVLDAKEDLSLAALAQDRAGLLAWVAARPLLAPVAFTTAYAAAIAFSLPIGLVLTLAGGFLFGPVLGTVCAVVGGTAGASALFVAARTALGSRLRRRIEAALRRMDAGFRDNAFNYLLFLRLVPVFPFWLVNIAPAFTGITLRYYVLATALGIVPGTLVYTLVGNGLGTLIDQGRTPDLGILFRPEILAPLIGLAMLSLAPVLLKRRRGNAPR